MTLTFPKFSVIPWNMDSETMLIVFSVVDNGGVRCLPEVGMVYVPWNSWLLLECVEWLSGLKR